MNIPGFTTWNIKPQIILQWKADNYKIQLCVHILMYFAHVLLKKKCRS